MADVPSGDAATEEAGRIAVEVVHARPDRWWREVLSLAAGATVADALAASRLCVEVPDLVVDPAHLAVHGRSVRPQATLHDGDRLEILRPLLCDPKEVRRLRAGQVRDGARGQRRR